LQNRQPCQLQIYSIDICPEYRTSGINWKASRLFNL
jgi:hypothetical protein